MENCAQQSHRDPFAARQIEFEDEIASGWLLISDLRPKGEEPESRRLSVGNCRGLAQIVVVHCLPQHEVGNVRPRDVGSLGGNAINGDPVPSS
jgi:hypothetical protein